MEAASFFSTTEKFYYSEVELGSLWEPKYLHFWLNEKWRGELHFLGHFKWTLKDLVEWEDAVVFYLKICIGEKFLFVVIPRKNTYCCASLDFLNRMIGRTGGSFPVTLLDRINEKKVSLNSMMGELRPNGPKSSWLNLSTVLTKKNFIKRQSSKNSFPKGWYHPLGSIMLGLSQHIKWTSARYVVY